MSEAPKQQPWLISMEYRPVEYLNRRQLSGVLARDIVKSEMPPWKLLATQAMKLRAAALDPPGPGLVRAGDEIYSIFWAAQVPIGGLTEEEIDALS